MSEEWAIYSAIYGHLIPCLNEEQAIANAPAYGADYVPIRRRVTEWEVVDPN